MALRRPSLQQLCPVLTALLVFWGPR